MLEAGPSFLTPLDPAGMGLDPAGMGRDPAGTRLDPAGMGLDPAGMGLDLAGMGLEAHGQTENENTEHRYNHNAMTEADVISKLCLQLKSTILRPRIEMIMLISDHYSRQSHRWA